MSIRTSATHPLRIDPLPVDRALIGITFCPGKKSESIFGAPWDRDLDLDLDVIEAWRADAMLTLVETHEFEMLMVPDLPQAVRGRGLNWFHLPIRDVDVPDESFEEAWDQARGGLQRILDNDGRILVHCRGGKGRAGLVAARLLIDRGERPARAIDRVRSARSGAIETISQENYLKKLSGRKIHASLLAGAMGDSLGAEIEFLSLAEIQRRYPGGIQELPPYRGLKGAITDDTQMTLFTAEGLIRAHIRGILRGVCHPPGVVHHALLRWVETQNESAAREIDRDSGLITDKRLRHRRAPGNTCLSSLVKAVSFGDLAQNNSKGCGTIMRVAPIGLGVSRELVRGLAVETSALTHGHVTGQLAAAAWAELLAGVAAGADVEKTAVRLYGEYAELEGGHETAAAIRIALDAPRDGAPRTVENLSGGGWIAEEALTIALYTVLSTSSLEDGLQCAVTHSGDSDSTGAIAGSLLGLIYPHETLSHRWASEVECTDIIERLAYDLAAAPFWSEDEADERFEEYPGW